MRRESRQKYQGQLTPPFSRPAASRLLDRLEGVAYSRDLHNFPAKFLRDWIYIEHRQFDLIVDLQLTFLAVDDAHKEAQLPLQVNQGMDHRGFAETQRHPYDFLGEFEHSARCGPVDPFHVGAVTFRAEQPWGEWLSTAILTPCGGKSSVFQVLVKGVNLV